MTAPPVPTSAHDPNVPAAVDTTAGPTMWDRRYAEHSWPSEPDPVLVELVTPLVPGTAVDLGCGPGRNAVWLAGRGWQVTGVDTSSVGLGQAIQRAAEAGTSIETVQADLTGYEAPAGGFDLVVLANIHPAPHERGALFAQVAAAVAPGGHLYVVGHHVDDLGRAGPPDPERLYTEAVLADAFPTLTVERLERSDRRAGGPEATLRDVVLWAVRPGVADAPDAAAAR